MSIHKKRTWCIKTLAICLQNSVLRDSHDIGSLQFFSLLLATKQWLFKQTAPRTTSRPQPHEYFNRTHHIYHVSFLFLLTVPPCAGNERLDNMYVCT